VPPSGEAFSDRTEHKVGRIGRRSANPVKMPINTHLGSSSGYHGRPAATAPNTAGEVLPGSSAGQVGDPPPASPHTPPPFNVCFCIKIFCDVGRRGTPCSARCWNFGDFCYLFWILLLQLLMLQSVCIIETFLYAACNT
jgi:hypothetical protein